MQEESFKLQSDLINDERKPLDEIFDLNTAAVFDKEKSKSTLAQAEQSLANAQTQSEPQKELFKSTNIEFLDNKLKNNKITMYDAYIAKKYLGMDLSEYGSSFENATHIKGMGATTSNDRMFDDLANSEMLFNAIQGSQGNMGFWDGISTKIHKNLIKNWDLDENKREWLAINDNLANAHAKNLAGGRINAQTQKMAKELFDFGTGSAQTGLNNYLAALKLQEATTRQNIQNNLNKGVSITPEILANYKRLYKGVEFMENERVQGRLNDDFDYSGFAKIRNSRFDNQAQNSKNEKNLRKL